MSKAPQILKLDDFLPYRLSVVSNLVSRVIEETYMEDGLKQAEWRVLAVVAEAPGRTQRDVAARTRMDKVTVSRAVQALSEKALVTRAANPADGRSQLLTLTKTGDAMYQRIMPAAQAKALTIWDRLPAGEGDALFETLATVEAAALAAAKE
ncbi:winged helix-turn-helix transcriptional regulator [Pacificimonas sp. WHA3]|uniref:Winged helix-turn-helix transcriptional regulator n=1 Tax=Pacificimonas pallii TaxID=2827236 RepID=A0ABS6SHW7_9SPHN|nr:MarR family winged helix-turn-helix transcriptional regulator [Pacificimonas pallii]MBV7257850.1 winged helix-turn-helix transcriptional regulator [Pacificimonas pallii]